MSKSLFLSGTPWNNYDNTLKRKNGELELQQCPLPYPEMGDIPVKELHNSGLHQAGNYSTPKCKYITHLYGKEILSLYYVSSNAICEGLYQTPVLFDAGTHRSHEGMS